MYLKYDKVTKYKYLSKEYPNEIYLKGMIAAIYFNYLKDEKELKRELVELRKMVKDKDVLKRIDNAKNYEELIEIYFSFRKNITDY